MRLRIPGSTTSTAEERGTETEIVVQECHENLHSVVFSPGVSARARRWATGVWIFSGASGKAVDRRARVGGMPSAIRARTFKPRGGGGPAAIVLFRPDALRARPDRLVRSPSLSQAPSIARLAAFRRGRDCMIEYDATDSVPGKSSTALRVGTANWSLKREAFLVVIQPAEGGQREFGRQARPGRSCSRAGMDRGCLTSSGAKARLSPAFGYAPGPASPHRQAPVGSVAHGRFLLYF